MSLHYAIRGFFRKYKAHGSIYGDWHFGRCRNSNRKYSIHVYKPKRSYQRIRRETSKRLKQGDKENVNRKVYMRDVVRDISNILRFSSWDSAQEQLQRLPIKWDSFTVNQVLKSHPPMEKAWLFFNWISKQKDFKHDQYTYTTMLDIFGEARRIDSMKYVFQQMQEKGIKINAVTYTSIFHWLSNNGDFDGAMKIWEEMKAKHCHPTVVSYTAYMKVLFDNNRAEEATELYKEMLQSGISPTCHTYTILMVHLICSGKCKSALDVFKNMQETGVHPDKAACNILVEQCSKTRQAWAINQILHYMKENSLVLRFPVYLQAYETLKMAGESDALLRQVNPHITYDANNKNVAVKCEETEPDVKFNIERGLLITFLRKKNYVAIDLLLTGIVNHNMWLEPELVSEIIEANCAHGRTDSAMMAFDYSKNMGIQIQQGAYLSLMGVLIRTNGFSRMLQILEQMVKFRFFLEPQFTSCLIYRLGCARELDTAVKIFCILPEEIKTTTVYTALLDACFSAGDPERGIETFKTMKTKGILCASGTYNVLIRGLETCGRVDQAKVYRKEKRSLQTKDHVSETVLLEEKICDILFAGYIAS